MSLRKTILGRKSAEMDVPFLTVIFLENVLGDLFRNLLLSFEWRFYALFHWLLYVFILMTRRYIYYTTKLYSSFYLLFITGDDGEYNHAYELYIAWVNLERYLLRILYINN